MTDRDEVGKYQHGHNQPGPGRPTAYRRYFAELAFKFCLLGATDTQLAEFFNVSESTIYVWKHEYPAFLEAIDRGKAVADGMVAESLFKRATGYTTTDTHVSNYQGQSRLTELRKHYPPDTAACIFWLKNRQPTLWRDKHVTEVSGPDGLKELLNEIDGKESGLPQPLASDD